MHQILQSSSVFVSKWIGSRRVRGRQNHGCQMAIATFLDCRCLALWDSRLWVCYATLQNLIPSFPWIVPPPRSPPWRNPRKGRDQILSSGNLGQNKLLIIWWKVSPDLIQHWRQTERPQHGSRPSGSRFSSCVSAFHQSWLLLPLLSRSLSNPSTAITGWEFELNMPKIGQLIIIKQN